MSGKKQKVIATCEDAQRSFRSILEEVSAHRTPRDLFRDFLEVASIVVSQMPYNAGAIPKDERFNEREAQYFAIAKRHSEKEMNAFASLLGVTTFAVQTFERDFLGPIYMDFGANERNGEFYTPESLGITMARMTLTRSFLESILNQKQLITISDPACGSGGLLIEAYQVIKEELQIDDASDRVLFHAVDVSRNAFNMCVVQLGLLGVMADIYHGNTLSLETFEHRDTPALALWRHQCRTDPALRMLSFLRQLEQETCANRLVEQPNDGDAIAEEAVAASKLEASEADVTFTPQQLKLFE